MGEEVKCAGCKDEACDAKQKRSGEKDRDFQDRQALAARMCLVKRKILVLSGKGGVGKSTVAVNLATALARKPLRVGLLDVDIHGPSVPKLLNLQGKRVEGNGRAMLPIKTAGNLKVMSIGLLMESRDEAVIWRGPMKYNVIKQLLKDVEWGELDYLVVDSPPGTGDEPLAVAQLIEKADGAVVVTTPQEVAVQDVRRSIRFCQQLNLPVLGVIENMSGLTCPKCGEVIKVFNSGGGRAMAEEFNVPFLGEIPLEPELVSAGDSGVPLVESKPQSPVAQVFSAIAARLHESLQTGVSG